MSLNLTALLCLAAEDAAPPATTPSATTLPARTPPSGTDQLLQMLPILVIIVVVFYFFIISPQRKQEKQRRQMLDAVAKGDKVVTIGGVHATVVQLKDEEAVLDVGDNTKMTFSRGAIARVIKPGESAKEQK